MKQSIRQLLIILIILMTSTSLTLITLELITRGIEAVTTQKPMGNSNCKTDAEKLNEDYASSYHQYHYPANTQSTHCSVDFGITYHFDANGYRNSPTQSIQKSSVLALGDSFTFGYGVQDNETFANLLGAYNGGLWGQTFDRHLLALNHILEKKSPKQVLWGIYPAHLITMTQSGWNSDCPGSVTLIKHIPNQFLPAFDFFTRAANKVKIYSRLYQWVLKRTSFRNFGLNNNQFLMTKECYLTKEQVIYDPSYLTETDSANTIHSSIHTQLLSTYTKFSELMVEAKKIETKNKFKFLFYFFPSKLQLKMLQEHTQLKPMLANEQMIKLIQSAGFSKSQIIDLTSLILQENWSSLYFNEDAHWNPIGHRFISNQLKPYLVR